MPLGYPYRRRLAFPPGLLVVLAIVTLVIVKWPHFADRGEWGREMDNANLRRYVTGQLLLHEYYPDAESWQQGAIGYDRDEIAKSIVKAYSAADGHYLDDVGRIEWALVSAYLGDRESAMKQLSAVDGGVASHGVANGFISDGTHLPQVEANNLFSRADQIWWSRLLSREGDSVAPPGLAAEAFARYADLEALHLALVLLGVLCLPFAVVFLWRGTARQPSGLERSWGTNRVLGAFVIAELGGTMGSLVFGYSFAGSSNPDVAVAAWALAWVFMIVAPAAILILILSPGLFATGKLMQATTHSWRAGGALLLGCYCILIGVNVVLEAMVLDEYELLDMGLSEIDGSISMLIVSLFTGVVCAPIAEEVVFRGFLFRGLRARIGVVGGVLASSCLFTLIHQYSAVGMFSVFLFGATIALIYHRTGSLMLCIGLHALYNLVIIGSSSYFYWLVPMEPLGL